MILLSEETFTIFEYRTPRIFHGMYISWLSMETGFLRLKFHG